MGARTDEQLATILNNAKINMFGSSMDIGESLTEGIDPAVLPIENGWIKQSALIHLLESRFSTNSQKQKAADEIERLGFGNAKFSGYWSPNYSDIDYAQNQDAEGDVAPITSSYLQLDFGGLANVPVTNPYSVTDWNTFFDLPTNGTPFTSVSIDVDIIKLYGGGGMTISNGLFSTGNGIYLRNIQDYSGSIVAIQDYAFSTIACINFILPNVINISPYAFNSVTGVLNINIRSCTNLGGTVGNNNVFNGIAGNTITLTVPSALMTCNSSLPDGDIQYLQSNNTVSIITV